MTVPGASEPIIHQRSPLNLIAMMVVSPFPFLGWLATAARLTFRGSNVCYVM
jgi:hypothetical protein